MISMKSLIKFHDREQGLLNEKWKGIIIQGDFQKFYIFLTFC